MKSRLEKFTEYINHIEKHPIMRKLSLHEISQCMKFMVDTADLSRDDFAHKLNRLFLDCPEKPKNWVIMDDMMTRCNVSDDLGKNRRE